MQLKTLLNRVHPVKGFVYGKLRQVEDDSAPNGLRIEVEVQARKGSRGLCSGCGEAGPGYDRQPVREFDFVPLWGIAVTLLYALRRVDCPACGVKGAVIAETQSSPLPPRRWKLPAQPGGVKVDRPEGGDPCTHGEGP